MEAHKFAKIPQVAQLTCTLHAQVKCEGTQHSLSATPYCCIFSSLSQILFAKH